MMSFTCNRLKLLRNLPVDYLSEDCLLCICLMTERLQLDRVETRSISPINCSSIRLYRSMRCAAKYAKYAAACVRVDGEKKAKGTSTGNHLLFHFGLNTPSATSEQHTTSTIANARGEAPGLADVSAPSVPSKVLINVRTPSFYVINSISRIYNPICKRHRTRFVKRHMLII